MHFAVGRQGRWFAVPRGNELAPIAKIIGPARLAALGSRRTGDTNRWPFVTSFSNTWWNLAASPQ
jgi:hypothetical protein